MNKWISPAIFLALIGAVLGAASAPSPAFGTLDMTKVREQFKAYQEANKKFQEFMTAETRELQKFAIAWSLDDKDRDRLLKLMDITAQTTTQREEVQTLLKQHNDKQARYTALQGKESRTPAETTEYQTLDMLYKRRQQDLDRAQDDSEARTRARQQEMQAPLDAHIQTVAGLLAQERGYLAVLLKETVVWGGVDITDDFVQRLNATPVAPK